MTPSNWWWAGKARKRKRKKKEKEERGKVKFHKTKWQKKSVLTLHSYNSYRNTLEVKRALKSTGTLKQLINTILNFTQATVFFRLGMCQARQRKLLAVSLGRKFLSTHRQEDKSAHTGRISSTIKRHSYSLVFFVHLSRHPLRGFILSTFW